KVIVNIVSHEKSAFIAGHQILDGPLILSENVDWFQKKKKKLLIFKVDFEKAFDPATIYVNGRPTSKFSIKRGLRQGYPLSLFLFILVMERLHNALSIVSEKDCLIIDRIDHGQWLWNWSMPNLGARNSADLLDMHFEISFVEINEVEDTCVWLLGTDGTVSIKDARYIIDSKILQYLAPSTVWDKNIPQKAISCPSCNGNMESSNHIFLECKIAKDIWMVVRKWCDIYFPPFTSYEHWKGWFTS
ncbi:RNA-directed DNA polymerase, eukaryota, partial [Tanacetum coccineum]